MGADILCIKDMAGLLKPKAARILVSIKEATGLPCICILMIPQVRGWRCCLRLEKRGVILLMVL